MECTGGIDAPSSLSEDCSTKEDISHASLPAGASQLPVPLLSMSPLRNTQGFINVLQALKVLSTKSSKKTEIVCSTFVIAQSLTALDARRPITLDCSICEAFISILDSAWLAQDEILLPIIVSSIQRLLTIDERNTSRYQGKSELGLYCVHIGLIAKLIFIIKGNIASKCVIGSVSELVKTLTQLSRLVSNAVFASHLIRDLTDICLNNINCPVGIVRVCRLMFDLMSVNSAFDNDHNLALFEATEAMRLYPNNAKVTRIAAVILCQKKWLFSKLLVRGSREHDSLLLVLALLRKHKKDKCTILCCTQALQHVIHTSAGKVLLEYGICHTMMELIYRNKDDPDITDAIVRFSRSLSDAFSNQMYHEKQNVEGVSESHKVGYCVDILNSLSMDYNWKSRRNFCLFLALSGFVHDPRGMCTVIPRCVSESTVAVLKSAKLLTEIASFL
jgi:hypothetical protein